MSDIGKLMEEAAKRFAEMPPVERALMLDDQAASFSGGGPSVLATEVRRLRAQLAEAEAREMRRAAQEELRSLLEHLRTVVKGMKQPEWCG